MSMFRHVYFGIVSREHGEFSARVELPDRPAVTVTCASEGALVGAVDQELGRVLGCDTSGIEVYLFGSEGGEEPVYAGAAVFDGEVWHTQFPAQHDLSTGLSVLPSPSYANAEQTVRASLAEAVGRPGEALDIEFFEIVPEAA
ncbi:hypothetical protein QNO07_02845 [Streptomyces sp. 549]|uniref:hypothetical protein n=1 Tax=Streptomyces sp. 549 TaxID=3049076 RepID=UPI0024C429DC|nr:hypothetical protein [Streptomyces sp. 549]MDK1472372.1 hypothetical protein [Streptomyces sp. 549]